MSTKLSLIILWILLIIGMILHFNYHVGEIFYGIDIEKPDANGEVPIGTFIIRSIFYHLPMIWILVIIYTQKPIINLLLFIISIIYLLAHISHLIGESMQSEIDLSQFSLLSLVLVVSTILCFEHYRYWRTEQG